MDITTPCIVCAVQAQVKNSAFWASRGPDWPVTEVAGHTVHAMCAHEAGYLAAHACEIATAAGVARWTTSGHVLPQDCAALVVALGLAEGIDLAATAAARDTETRAAIEQYRAQRAGHGHSPEELAGMRAAFGPGQVVVDLLTGEDVRL